MKVEWDGNGTYSHSHALEDGRSLRLMAQSLRRERTGLHGRLSVLVNSTVLAWSNFNLERDEDRVRLTNSAFSHLEGARNAAPAYPKAHLKHDLDLFCRELETALLESISVESLAGDISHPAPTFVLEPYVLEGGGTILFAPPKRGKSYATLLMAVSIDAGLSGLFRVPKPRRVLFVNLERSGASMARRLGAVNRCLGVDGERPLLFINARGKSLADVAERVRTAMHERACEVLFLDSISRAGAGDLNENVATNRITDLLNGLAPTWLALGHTPRSDESHVYGSIHFEAAADVLVQLSSQKNFAGTLGMGLRVVQANDVDIPPPGIYALEFRDGGLVAARDATAAEFPELAAAKQERAGDTIRAYLLRVGRANFGQVLRGTGLEASVVRAALANDPRFGSSVAGGEEMYVVLAKEGAPAPKVASWPSNPNEFDEAEDAIF